MCIAAVTAAAALPSGYLEFEYIQGNGSDARIVTDYTPTPNQDKIEAVVSFPSGALSKNQAIWCARGTGGQDRTWTLFALKDSSDNKYRFRFDYNGSTDHFVASALSENTQYTVTANGPTFTWSGGTGTTHTKADAFTEAGGPLVMFYSYATDVENSKNNWGKFKLFSFKVWHSGLLIHDLVPALRLSDYKSGLYDVAGNKFYAGTGTFTLMDYWNTKGYVEASPNETASGAFDFTSFTTNEQPSDTIRRFSSDAPVGTFLYLR